jgi:hypothetical protein
VSDVDDETARTLVDATADAAAFLVALISGARAVGGDDAAVVTRLVTERLIHGRPADRDRLRAVLAFAETFDVSPAMAARGWRPARDYPGGWRPPTTEDA